MEQLSVLIKNPWLIHFSGPVLIIVLVLLFWWRAGSIHSVFERLWRLAAGKAEVTDPKLKRFVQEARDIEKFRFVYGLKVGSLMELHQLLEWMKASAISVASAQKARRWIDIRSPEVIATPPKNYFVWKVITGILLVALLVFSSEVLSLRSAILQTKATKVWFLMDNNTIKHIMGDWTIDLKICSKGFQDLQRTSQFSESEANSICSAFADNSLPQFVSNVVRLQRWFGFVFGVLAFVGLADTFLKIVSAQEARKIKKQISDNPAKTAAAPMLDQKDTSPRIGKTSSKTSNAGATKNGETSEQG